MRILIPEMRKIRRTAKFKKDYKEAIKRGISKSEIQYVVGSLAEGNSLPVRYRDHNLTGKWTGYRECHIRPDWLLVYRIDDEVMTLVLVRMGSHSELFGM